MRTLREIKSCKVYEICCRARDGLPLPPNRTINAIIRGIMARTQRDDKVVICHYLWMSNHFHIIIRTKDAESCMKFYMEIQKKLTDVLKRLLGLSYLNLWEGTPMVAEVASIASAKDRIAYIYANPSAADLESSVELYPGLSSWQQFEQSASDLEAKVTERVPWIRTRVMEELPSPALSLNQDKFFADKFIKSSKKYYELTIEPNAWMKCFNITDPTEVTTINQSIKEDLRLREKNSIERRALTNKKVMGAPRLATEPIMKAHKPKKKSRNVFVLCVERELRISCIRAHQEFCQVRRERYEEWKKGDFSSPWPPGAFRPPMPPLANAVEFNFDSFF